jgi:hypothetical protein
MPEFNLEVVDVIFNAHDQFRVQPQKFREADELVCKLDS